ncbi:flagellar export protein FliJ [Blastococcus sp. CCUG 61487]|uniref:flagellar export protein FliJ n=1 Tax=Blastococcus sp. CCUG 61487 TaxID=1840703 RepID=UPI0010C13888|nr:flagellar export protein FliJ [Blastococcus sp. CCUG 61487]TKJ21475.1 flagellar export protein FliJ [Blastococcus sp. CCUG 61487]
MKRSTFRLQAVLELRRTQERAAAVASAEAARAAAEAARQATAYETALAAATLPRTSSSEDFRAAMTLLRVAATDASDARAAATASAEQAEAVRALWTAAAQRTRGLERLRERHLEQQLIAELAAEERAVDDLVTGRAGRGTPGEVPWTP